ncbi:hypothetical protein BDQ12DRAFT_613280, partial [Crucibulum laeve]
TTFLHLLFLVYPILILPKYGPTALGSSAVSPTGNSSTRRRLREEPDITAEGGGEAISTSSVAMKAERYRPRIYSFQLNEIAKPQRWQEAVRDRQVAQLEALEQQT